MIVPPLLPSCAALPDKTTVRDSPPGKSTSCMISMLLFLSVMLQPVRSTDAVVVFPITTTSLPGSSPLGLTEGSFDVHCRMSHGCRPVAKTRSKRTACRNRLGPRQAMPGSVVRGQPLCFKPEKEPDVSRSKFQNQPAILEHSIIIGEGTGLRVTLVHVDIVEPLDSAKLVVDWPGVRLLPGRREYGSEREKFTALISQLL